MQKRVRGFTIVELLIVIVVIGILAALVLNTFAGIQGRAHDSSVKNDLKNISKALAAYKTTSPTNAYPSGATGADVRAVLESLNIKIAPNSYSTEANSNLVYFDEVGTTYMMLAKSKSGMVYKISGEQSAPTEYSGATYPFPGSSFSNIRTENGLTSGGVNYVVYVGNGGGFRIWNP